MSSRNKIISSLEGYQDSPARPSDKSSIKLKVLKSQEEVTCLKQVQWNFEFLVKGKM